MIAGEGSWRALGTRKMCPTDSVLVVIIVCVSLSVSVCVSLCVCVCLCLCLCIPESMLQYLEFLVLYAFVLRGRPSSRRLVSAVRVEQLDAESAPDGGGDQQKAVRGVEGAEGDRGRSVRRHDVCPGEFVLPLYTPGRYS